MGESIRDALIRTRRDAAETHEVYEIDHDGERFVVAGLEGRFETCDEAMSAAAGANELVPEASRKLLGYEVTAAAGLAAMPVACEALLRDSNGYRVFCNLDPDHEGLHGVLDEATGETVFVGDGGLTEGE